MWFNGTGELEFRLVVKGKIQISLWLYGKYLDQLNFQCTVACLDEKLNTIQRSFAYNMHIEVIK